jgi:hypothetical protein
VKIVEFLSYLRSLDIQVFVESDRNTPPEEIRLHCNAPEGSLTAELRTEIQQRKAEIISFLRVANRTTSHTSTPLLPISRDRTLPVSFAQQRLWFLDQLIPNNAFYNTPAALCLTGSLNLAALEQTFNEIVRRHEALRTTFVTVQGQPVQVITPTLKTSLPVIDLQDFPEAERETEARRLTVQEAQRPFDLSKGPLLRVTLLRLDESEYVLLLILHHIVSDGWSMGVLIREIAALYTAYLEAEDENNSSSTFNLQPSPSSFLNYPSSMQTLPTGSASGCKGKCWQHNLLTGDRSWTAFLY